MAELNLFGEAVRPPFMVDENSVKGRYGFLPTSVWYCTKRSQAARYILDAEAELTIKKGKAGGARMSEFDPEVADRVAVSFPPTLDAFPGRSFVSGTPIRSFAGMDRDRARAGLGVGPDDRLLLAQFYERQAAATPAGVVIALNRQERGQGSLSAVAEVEKLWNIRVTGIATLDTLVAYLGEQRELRHHLAAIEAYRAQYGG